MVNQAPSERIRRVAYKTYLALFPLEWEKLEAEAKKRGVSGREVIEAALSKYCATLPVPKRQLPEAEPLPEYTGED